MYVRAKEVFDGTSESFRGEFKGICSEKRLERGTVLYRSGDHAAHFFVLEEGHVRLSYGSGGYISFTMNKAGNAFGLSSLLGRPSYAGSAECMEPSRLSKINQDDLDKLLKKYPEDAGIFFRRLSRILFQKMTDGYNSLLSAYGGEKQASYG
jgi:CRP-like cAMP-binding protein